MHGEGPLLVLAGPGSGKTYTITQRIFYLLERKIEPEKILVITFTKDAALSMQSRFQQLSERTLPVHFGTFHSVFYHILRESHFFESNQSNQILTDSQKRKIIIPIIRQTLSKEELQNGQNDLTQEAVTMLSAISYYKNTGDKKEAEKKLTGEMQEHFQTIFDAYERERCRRRAVDFDDMVYECRRVLSRDEKLREYWQGRFQHILIDEFQDINFMQYEVIRLLSAKPYNLFAVGDDDQAIYGFRGANPACLKQFVEDYRARRIVLECNYRSTQEIIDASLKVIGENKERFHKKMVSAVNGSVKASSKSPAAGKHYEGAVTLRSFEEREQQYQYLVEKLREQNTEEQVGILFRTNAYMQGLATRLSREGISYRMKEKATSIYDHFIMRDIVAYLQLSRGKGKREQFLQIMNKPSRYISRDSLGLGESVPTYQELIQYYRQRGLDSHDMQVIWSIEKWEQQMKYLSRLSPFLAVQYIRKVVGYEEYLRKKAGAGKEQWLEWEEYLNWAGTDAAGYASPEEWLEAQKQYTLKRKDNTDEQEEKSTIQLMTVHAAKGLEFDRVYIPDCNEKIFPHGNMPDEKSCQEERRILYVAMTRAKENLELLYLTGTKERPRLPSRFLNPLFQNYSSINSSNSQLSRYSS